MKLSPKQNAILYCLQNGWCLITDSHSRYVCCAGPNGQFNFSLTIFYNMVRSELIYQQISSPFNYVITSKGRNMKTKPWDFSPQKNKL